MEIILSLIIGAAAGAGVSIWRLKGSRTVTDTLRAVIQGGGGPGEEQPGK